MMYPAIGRTRRKGHLLTAGLCVVLALATILPAPCQGIEDGAWEPVGKGVLSWTVEGDRLRFDPPNEVGSWIAIESQAPVPEDGWTLEFAACAYDEHGGRDTEWGIELGERNPDAVAGEWQGWLQITVERRSSDRIVSARIEMPSEPPMTQARQDLDQAYARNCTAPAALLELAWKPDAPLQMLLNGRLVELELPGLTPPAGPLRIVAKGGGALDVAQASVGPWRDLVADGLPGMAHDGWSAEPTGGELAEAERIPTLLDWIVSMQAQPPHVRAHAIAARHVYDFATAGEVTLEAAQQAQALLEETIEEEPAAAARLLPVAVACEDEADREAAWEWTDRLMSTFAEWSGGGLKAEDRYRATLLDPVRACLVGDPPTLSPAWAESLVGDLQGRAQAVALLSLASRNDHMGYVWLLPQYLRAHPAFGQLMIAWVEDWGRREHVHVDEPDRTLSMAAWRLAPVRPAKAMALAEMIEDPEVLGDTLVAVSEALPEGGEIAEAAEEALRRSVEQWEPRTPRSTIVRPMARLARFYAAHDRMDEAREVAREAATHVDDQPDAKAWAMRLVALLMRDLQMDEAEAWFDRAVEAAVANDNAYSGPESGRGIVWLSATQFIVRDLVERGQIERALEITRRLSPERIPENYAICMSSIIYAIDEEDPARALELLEEVPQVRQRSSLVANLIPKVAQVDPEAALALVEELPERVRPIHRWRILRASGQEPDEATVEAWHQALAASIESIAAYGDPWRSRPNLLRELDSASPAEVVALEQVLSVSPEYLARLLLEVTVRSAGLADDPIWRRFVESEQGPYGKIPWGAASIRDWQRCAEEMAEEG